MKKFNKLIILIFLIMHSNVYSSIPQPQTRYPNVPYFMETMGFQTAELDIFSKDIGGMIIDKYSDLAWNPAFLVNQQSTSIYLDFNFTNSSYYSSPNMTIDYGCLDETSSVYNNIIGPDWYNQSSINSLNTNPFYTLAILKKISEKLSIGIFNRSIFDYGPYRSNYYWYGNGWADETTLYDAGAINSLTPEALEIDDNQQHAWGNQSEIYMSYKLSKKIDLGFSGGNYIFRRNGNLYDTKFAYHPHSSFADLDEEDLKICGDQYQFGAGLIYHLNEKSKLGVYGTIMTGKSIEESNSLDTLDNWSERDTDAAYYHINENYYSNIMDYSENSIRPQLTLTFEKKMKNNLVFRSFISYYSINSDISANSTSMDTSYSDNTYDTYHNNFQRIISDSKTTNNFSGVGKRNTNYLKWFASLIYAPDNNWSIFGAIRIMKKTQKIEYDESTNFQSHSFNDYNGYETKTIEYFQMQELTYSYNYNYQEWTALLPVGIKAKVVKGLYAVFGADLYLEISDNDQAGKRLYPNKVVNRWENGIKIVDDVETDRSEEYTSNPQKIFYRNSAVHFGAVYRHPSGVKVFIRSNNNIFSTGEWTLGFELDLNKKKEG